MLQDGLAAIVRSQPEMVLIGQASNCRQAIEMFVKLRPDVTLMDLRLPDMSGIDDLIAIRSQFPDARIIMMTTFEGDGPVQRALEAGAYSCILKNRRPQEMIDAIRQVCTGKKRVPAGIVAQVAEHLGEQKLSVREVEVLVLTADGNRNRDIAQKLVIAEETVKAHMRSIMEKLGASDRTQAFTIALRRGLIQL